MPYEATQAGQNLTQGDEMVSLYGLLNLGSRGVSAAQAGINTTGQNIANANTEGYSRQRVDQQAATPVVLPNGAFGQGVEIVSIERIRDAFLERQIRGARSDSKFNEELDSLYVQLENIINDPLDPISNSIENSSSGGLNNSLSRFFETLNDLSLDPAAPELRSAAVESAQSLVQTFNLVGEQLRLLRSNLDEQTSNLVDEINKINTEIASLNERISISEVSANVNANDLRDQRDLLLSQLAEIIPISTEEQANGSIDVNLAGERLVDGVNARQIVKIPTESDDQLVINKLRIGPKGLDVKDDLIRGGELGAILQGRDQVVPFFAEEIDTLARAVVFELNKIHGASAGLEGYQSIESHFRIPDGSTEPDTTQTLNEIFNDPRVLASDSLADKPFPIQDGSFRVRVSDEDNQTKDAYDVNVRTDDTLFQLVERIDRADGIVGKARSALAFDPVFTDRATARVGITAAEAGSGLGALAAAAGTPIAETPGAYSFELRVKNAAGGLVDADPTTPDVEPFVVNFDDTMTLSQFANAIQNASNQTVRALVVPDKNDPSISTLQLSSIEPDSTFSIQNDSSGIMQAFDFPITDTSIPLVGGDTEDIRGRFFGRSDQSFLGGGSPAFSPAFPGPPPSVIREQSFELVVLDNNNIPTVTTITLQAGVLETMDQLVTAIEAADPNLDASITNNNELRIQSDNNRSFFFQNDQTGLIEALGFEDVNGFGSLGGVPFSEGSFEIVVANKEGTVTHIVDVPVQADPSTVGGVLTLQGIVDQINASTGASNVPIFASIVRDPANSDQDVLQVEAIGDFEFTFRSDDSLLLSALGFTAGPVLDPTGDNPIQGAEFPIALGDNIGGLVRAEIVNDTQIKITTSDKEQITFLDDSSHFLAAAGINSLFYGSDSRSMRLNEEILSNNRLFATSKDGSSGNNEGVQQMAELQSARVINGQSLGEFYRTTISSMGIESSRARQFFETNRSILKELENFQEQNAGVSLDEESINIIRYQQAFQASARVIRTVDEMIDVVINQIGR